MRLQSTPTCVETGYVFNPTTDQCEPDYGAITILCPDCLQFNSTTMACDNKALDPFEVSDSHGDHTCHRERPGGVGFDGLALCGGPDVSYLDASGGEIPHLLTCPSPTPPHADVILWNPAVRWSKEKVFDACLGCMWHYQPIQVVGPDDVGGYCGWTFDPITGTHSGLKGGGFVSGPHSDYLGNPLLQVTSELLGCPSPYVAIVDATPGDHTSPAGFFRPSTDDPRSEVASSSPVCTSVSFESVPNAQGDFDSILHCTSTSQGCCYEPVLVECPTNSDTHSPPCLYDPDPVTCPSGYVYEPTLNLCLKVLPDLTFMRHPLTDECIMLTTHTDGSLYCDIYVAEDTVPVLSILIEAGSLADPCQRPIITDSYISNPGSGQLYVTYERNTPLKLATSDDIGRTWVVTTLPVASNYKMPCPCWASALHATGFVVIALFDPTSGGIWQYVTATPDVGDTFVFSAVRDLVTFETCANTHGELKQRPGDGVFEFAYVTALGNVRVIRCESLAPDGTGVWV